MRQILRFPNNEKASLDILIYLLLFIAIVSIPFDFFFKNLPFLSKSLQILVNLSFSLFLILYVKRKEETPIFYKQDQSLVLFFIPTLIVCFSNYFYALFAFKDFNNSISYMIIFDIVLTFITVFNEEALFRGIIQPNLNIENPLKRIIVSALIFALFHLINFFSSFNPADLLILLYTFGLGLILGLILEVTRSFICVYSLHLIFNLFNGVLFSILFTVGNFWLYALTNVIVALVVGIYLLLIYIFKLKTRLPKALF